MPCDACAWPVLEELIDLVSGIFNAEERHKQPGSLSWVSTALPQGKLPGAALQKQYDVFCCQIRELWEEATLMVEYGCCLSMGPSVTLELSWFFQALLGLVVSCSGFGFGSAAVDMYKVTISISILGFHFWLLFWRSGFGKTKGLREKKRNPVFAPSPHPQHINLFWDLHSFPFVQDVWIWLGFTCSYCRKWTFGGKSEPEGGSQLEMSVPGTWHPSKTNLSLEWGPRCHTLPRCRVLRSVRDLRI